MLRDRAIRKPCCGKEIAFVFLEDFTKTKSWEGVHYYSAVVFIVIVRHFYPVLHFFFLAHNEGH